MIKRIATAAAVAGAVLTFAPAANAAPVTCAQFSQVQTALPGVQQGQGTSRYEVARIFGTHGHRIGEWTVPGGQRLLKAYRAEVGKVVVSYFRADGDSVFRAAIKSTAVHNRATGGLLLTSVCH